MKASARQGIFLFKKFASTENLPIFAFAFDKSSIKRLVR